MCNAPPVLSIEKPKRKPRVSKILEENAMTNTVVPTKPKKATRQKKSDTLNIIDTPKKEDYNTVVHPTYIEETLEEVNTDEYEIEYVPLSLVEIESTVYYCDKKKSKLYTRNKDKHVGKYIGRYHADTGSIYTDIPDSDEE